jgi:hypothetical protein
MRHRQAAKEKAGNPIGLPGCVDAHGHMHSPKAYPWPVDLRIGSIIPFGSVLSHLIYRRHNGLFGR